MSTSSHPKMTHREALYSVQRRALTDALAAAECAARYAAEVAPEQTLRFRDRIAAVYLLGLYGERNPYDHVRGGNFAASFRRAYRAGADLRRELEVAP